MKITKPVFFSAIPLVSVLLVFLALPIGTSADANVVTTSDDQTEIAITVYNDGTGLVKDTRKLNLPDGEFDLIFMDVASQIDATSVHFKSVTNPDAITVLEQNYEYDLVSTAALYQRNIDNKVKIRTGDGRTIEGTLLSYDGSFVLNTDSGIEIINNAVEISFAKLPEGLITRPTLRWSLVNDRSGNHDCEMSYLTNGMTWKANYVAVVGENDDKLDLSGWVTIDNTSGASYHDAVLKLVAGSVHRVQPYVEYRNQGTEGLVFETLPKAAPGFVEESFFEYHLYTLNRPATVLNNQQKQLSLLEGENIGVNKIFLYSPANPYYSINDTSKGEIEARLKFKNSKENGLGIPLPKGTIRVYKKDSSGSLQFIGEDSINHTPKDEDIEIFMGTAFDIVGERVVLYRRPVGPNMWEYDVKVTIRNHKEDDVVVTYWDKVWGDWEVGKSSGEYNQKDASTIEFSIPVKADGESVLTYTIRKNS